MNIRIDSKRVISQLFAAAMLVFPSLVLPSLMASAQAQTYPTKPVRFVSAFAPGGPVDVVARIVGQKLGETWGQQVLIENRAGAAGNIGSAYVAKQPADGYTVLVNSSSFAVNVSLTKDPGYDAERDFIPVLLEPERNSARGKFINWGLVDELTPLGGIRIEDNVLVTASGVENLTRVRI